MHACIHKMKGRAVACAGGGWIESQLRRAAAAKGRTVWNGRLWYTYGGGGRTVQSVAKVRAGAGAKGRMEYSRRTGCTGGDEWA